VDLLYVHWRRLAHRPCRGFGGARNCDALTIHEMIMVLEAFLSPAAVLAPALTKAFSGEGR
jgi:hypothetical protein